MRPNTSESGIFSTKRNSAVSVSMLTRMLVPKPKKAFQSPGVHIFGRKGEPAIASSVGDFRLGERPRRGRGGLRGENCCRRSCAGEFGRETRRHRRTSGGR